MRTGSPESTGRGIARRAVAPAVLLFMLLALFPNVALAWPNPSPVGSVGTGNNPQSVCVQGGYAYVVNWMGNTLQVLDVSDPASPTLAGSVDTDTNPASVCVQGGYAYVTNYSSNTLQVFDVSDPASPTLAGSADTGNIPNSVCVQGGYAYVVNRGSHTLEVFDVSNPASPTLAGFASTGTYPSSVCVQGGCAYVANESSDTLQVFDVSDPASPTEKGSANTGDGPYSVCLQGGYAYVANQSDNSLQVFDVSDPAAPSLKGSAGTGIMPQSVCVQGNYAYVANIESDTLQVFDVSDPASPTQVGSADTGSDPNSVCVQGAYAYVTNNGSNRLQVFRVCTPSGPSLAGSVDTGDSSYPFSVCVQGGYAYVAYNFSNALQVLDVSDPASPSLKGSAGTDINPDSVCVQGAYAYVTNNSSHTLQVCDVSDPASPTMAGSAGTGNNPQSVCVQGGFAYVVNYSHTLQVFDVSDPASPTLAGSAGTGNNPQSVCVQGGFAYVVNRSGSNMLQVFDVSDPASPTLEGSADTGTGAYSVCVQGGCAYVANWAGNTLQIFDVSDPASPTLAGSASTGDSPQSVCVQGDRAYVVNSISCTLQVFDVSDPASPTLAGSADTGESPTSVRVQGGYAYVANDSGSKLQVFSLWEASTPSLSTTTISSITETTADSGGTVTDNGGAPVTARGVCWNTTGNPTISDGHTADGSGSGSFTSHISGLTRGTRYYVRAYATNSAGTAYGDQRDFTTLAAPTLTTGSATSITDTGATLNGRITDTGGQNVDSRGFRYRKTGTSTWTTWTQTGSFSTGTFSHPVTGLTPVASYEFEAWARNSTDITYGSVMTFATTELPSGLSTWYLPEGTTAWGFSTCVSIQNPNESAVKAKITFMPKGASNVTETINLPAGSQTTLTNDHLVGKLGRKDFSTKVESTDATKPIAVDRAMEWTGPEASAPEGHSSVGVTSPATNWYLPEGSTNWGFETWLLIQNPGSTEASCDVTYMVEGKGPVTVKHKVPAHSRESYSMQEDIGNADASIKVVSSAPVISERAMYRYNRREGHDSIGTTTPAKDYYLAEGAVGYGSNYTTYVMVQNPQNSPTEVSLTFLTGSGSVPGPTCQMPANSRKTFRVNDYLPPNTDVSTSVHGSQDIIAERAMYWDSPAGEACHDSTGMSAPAMTFYLPDGQTSQGRETWTLVQNPNGTPVEVTITYMTPSGTGNVTRKETIPANSRKTFNMAGHSGISGRASIMVQAKAGTRPVMVERAMYWGSRCAGTDTIGASSE